MVSILKDHGLLSGGDNQNVKAKGGMTYLHGLHERTGEGGMWSQVDLITQALCHHVPSSPSVPLASHFFLHCIVALCTGDSA